MLIQRSNRIRPSLLRKLDYQQNNNHDQRHDEN